MKKNSGDPKIMLSLFIVQSDIRLFMEVKINNKQYIKTQLKHFLLFKMKYKRMKWDYKTKKNKISFNFSESLILNFRTIDKSTATANINAS